MSRYSPGCDPASSAGDNRPVESDSNAGQRRDIILLGSTGSIGTQAADIVRRNPDRFRLTAIAAGGGHPEPLARQAVELGVEVVAVASRGGGARPARCAGERPARPTAPGASCPRCSPARRHRRPRRPALRRRAERGHRRGRPRRDPGRAAGGPRAGAGQQGVADHGRAAGRGPRRARSDRARSTPSTRRSRSACAAAAPAEVRRLVVTASGGPFLHRAGPSWRTSHPSRRWRTRPGTWAR